jgi:hypothetical protein
MKKILVILIIVISLITIGVAAWDDTDPKGKRIGWDDTDPKGASITIAWDDTDPKGPGIIKA